MQAQQIIRQIDEWLDENGWRLGDKEIDFALDIRGLVAQLDEERDRVLTNA